MAAKETVIGKFVNQILFKVDKSSVDDAKSAISEVKGFAAKALGAIGIGIWQYQRYHPRGNPRDGRPSGYPAEDSERGSGLP